MDKINDNLNQESVAQSQTSNEPTPTNTATQVASNQTPKPTGDRELSIPKAERSDDKSETKEPVADFDYSRYEQEFMNSGDISKTSRDELYKLFPKNLVDNYIENMKTANTYLVSQAEKKAFEITGGEQGYTEMIAWASKNLSEDEIEAYNEAVSSGNERWALQAIKGLYARRSLQKGNEPKITLGSDAQSRARDDVFLTRQDYANAIADPKYRVSPQYRAQMDAKLANTLKLGGFKN